MPGSGRKPKLLTELLLSQSGAKGDIRYAYNLFVTTMKDESQPRELRLDAAREVLNRLCGKPAQAVQVGGPEGEPLGVDWGRVETALGAALAPYGEGARFAVAAALRGAVIDAGRAGPDRDPA